MEHDYLRTLFQRGTQVRVFVSNGFQLKGRIDDIGENGIILESDGKRKLIYYHAITTIEPM